MQAKILDTFVESINWSYKRTRRNGVGYSNKGKYYERTRVSVLVEFCQNLKVLSESQADEVWQWKNKWSIHPGLFAWGVDWSAVKAEAIPCLSCGGTGKVTEYDHAHGCCKCGGRGSENRARRGMTID